MEKEGKESFAKREKHKEPQLHELYKLMQTSYKTQADQKVISAKDYGKSHIHNSFYLHLSCFLLLTPTTCSNNETDLISLLAFKFAVNDPQGALYSWNETTHFCSWNGIQCGRRHPNRVVAINLRAQDLMGTLTPHIGSLSFLRSINLQNNSFSGEIPYEIGRLRRLEIVDFSNNSFIGAIPRNISQCPNLSYLNLIDNNLSAFIPQELGSLYKLEALGLSRNELLGPIPPSIGNLTSLRVLSLTLCGLTGEIPKSLVRLHKLTFLSLAFNNLVGTIPSGLFNISMLREFVVNRNQLQGSIPGSIGLTLPNLRIFYLGQNQLSGEIPMSLSNASSLERIQLTSNLFTGPIPRLERLALLSSLSIGDNPVKDDISFISSLTNCTKLERLFVYEIPLLTGPLPRSVVNFSSHLIELVISGTQIHGEIPSGIGNLVALTRLLLSNNDLDCPIPSDIGKLSSLQELFLEAKGSIPSEIGSLTNVENLDFSNNRLSGLIPNSLSNCLVMQQLFLEGNLLQGEIPQGLSALRGLVELDLSRNNLSGTIPSFLAELRLQRLNLSYNRFQGEVPRIGLFRNITAISLDGNKELCGGIPELNLPPCLLMTSSKKNSSSLRKVLIPIVVSGGVFFTFLLCLILILYRRGRPKKNVASVESLVGNQFTRLSYGDLLKATNGLSEANLIGSGRFGSVYKGILEDGQTLIAVKVLNLVVKGAVKSFIAECNALRDIRHRNLLKLLSVCESIDFQGNDFRSLIYDFKANGSLDKWLYHHEEQGGLKRLSLIQRLDIAIDVAHALEYLHFAKIVSNMFPAQESSSSIGIRGTIGYVAPEYGTSNLVSTQGDVYSYGILLLEIFTNRRPTDDSLKEYVTLHNFVSTALPDGVMEIITDPLIQIEHDKNINKIKDCMVSVLSIGVACSKDLPSDRMLIQMLFVS
ncbi:putative LRR receptor-like serine/threonine-protein kinase [Sesamum angolense]|uniref:LRR receptor-like serine/threonine-protein kinase n=1 Tax=Sesamum angolense TaxID=2727404 RepID=A0AAE1WIL4_9LAMI|nr:putative LRR receptor-like serine/threonine-protein kinase [Sesamum angolense]